jgi:hypothetical protein
MSDGQIQFILKILPVNQALDDIFIVLAQLVDLMIDVKKH